MEEIEISKDELKNCKHCGTTLRPSDIKSLPKKKLPPRYGLLWTGIEYPFLEIHKVTCNNLACQKKYTVKRKTSTWFYK